jgi:hypothetical protein
MTIALSTMKKDELFDFLETAKQGKLDDELQAKVESVLADPPNKGDVYDLAQTVKTRVKDLAPIENSLKKKSDDKKKLKPKKSGKKKSKKKTKKKKSGIKIKTETVQVDIPDKFEVEGIGEVTVNTELETIEEVQEARENGKDLIFATLWTKTHLKKYDYDRIGLGADVSDGFPNDLDLLAPVFISEKIAYAVSLYTDMVFYFKPNSFEVDEHGARVTSGMEWILLESVE